MAVQQVKDIRWPDELLDYVEVADERFDESSGSIVPGTVEPTTYGLRHCRTAKSIPSYSVLVRLVSRIAMLNPHVELFFRGESSWHAADDGVSASLKPLLWRDDPDEELYQRISLLKFRTYQLHGAYERYERHDPQVLSFMEESPIAQWALLQHYAVCKTPLLDVTRSLRVACSFALSKPSEVGYLFILGMPHQSETITTRHDAGIINVSLLGVTPSDAKRPLKQEGFLVGSSDWWRLYADRKNRYTKKDTVDFACRLIAALEIPDKESFWVGDETERIPVEKLSPRIDSFHSFLEERGFYKAPGSL